VSLSRKKGEGSRLGSFKLPHGDEGGKGVESLFNLLKSNRKNSTLEKRTHSQLDKGKPGVSDLVSIPHSTKREERGCSPLMEGRRVSSTRRKREMRGKALLRLGRSEKNRTQGKKN